MTKKKQKTIGKTLKKIWPYILTAVLTLALVFVGYIDKKDADMNLSLNNFASNNYNVSVDQISALYVVADISDSFNLASASDVASNYVVTTSMYSTGQTSTGKLEKPNLTNISVSRGVVYYEVREGDNMESIAQRYGISTDQIRWSNGKKTTDVSVGDVLYLPSTSGIVYTVKSGDTIDDIVSRYGSSVAEITELNDLEVSGISEGMRILIKNGSLPETERPEYVPPVTYTYSYSYRGDTSSRIGITVIGIYDGRTWLEGHYPQLGGRYGAGQCTQWAWYNRQDLPFSLGDARYWAGNAEALGYTVLYGEPVAGAVFQTNAGWWGHVGYVEAVNDDGSVVATEMNWNYHTYEAIRSTIPASAVRNLNYIYPPGM